MGGAARIVTAVATGGLSEIARPVGKATGVDKRLIDPLGTAVSTGLAAVGVKDKAASSAITPQTVTPFMTDAEREREARLAASQRRKDYQDMGRSSTILTGPGGLGGTGAGQQKTLLGY